MTLPGEQVSPDLLSIDKARQLASVSWHGLPFIAPVECLRLPDGDSEAVILDLEVERGQRTVHDIRRVERIAFIFAADDRAAPEVSALREDFPVVPHTNMRPAGHPRSLCLYDEPWEDVKLRWSVTEFLETARQWLALTATGSLHADDQPLEPLLWSGIRTLIVPHEAILRADARLVSVRQLHKGGHTDIYIAEPASVDSQRSDTTVAVLVRGKPQVHGLLKVPPENMKELSGFLEVAGIDLVEQLREQLAAWYRVRAEIVGCKLIVIAYLPKTRQRGGPQETFDVWAFDTGATIRDVGIDLGIWDANPGGDRVGLLLPTDRTRDGRNTPVGIMNVAGALTPALASFLNGLEPCEQKFVCIGVGALGSQIVSSLVRSGYGRWTIVDHDHLFPHNLARHALTGSALGQPKASSLAEQLNSMFASGATVQPVIANVLRPEREASTLEEAFTTCEAIVDASTSVAVARYLASDLPSSARRVSIFLNPSGSDLVVLAEDATRQHTLDLLEMQYYRFVASSAGWDDHLRPPSGRRRYSNACRDVSSVMPQDLVSLHAAIASRNLRRILSTADSEISIWRANPADMTVATHRVESSTMRRYQGEWTVVTDEHFVRKVQEMRESRLPNETGGVLLGATDMSRQIVYVVDFLPSPPDSSEWPTVYIRGCEGLPEALAQVHRRTAGMLQYVGEWHSHPRGFSSSASDDDRRAFDWLSDTMAPTGMPPLMLIVADDIRFYWGRDHRP